MTLRNRPGTNRSGSTLCALALCAAALTWPGAAAADFGSWWAENFEVHGFARSQAYWNSPSLKLDEEVQMTSWRNELNLESSLRVYSGDELEIGFFTVLRPSYEAIYDVYPNQFGKRRDSGKFGSQFGAPASTGFGWANAARDGDCGDVPGHGATIEGHHCDINQDTAFLFTGKNNPQMVIDNTIFFGALGGQSKTRGSDQPKLGGPSNLDAFAIRKLQLELSGATPATSGLLASFALAEAAGRNPFAPLRSSSQTVFGSRGSLKQAPTDINRTEGQLSTDCFDNANRFCWAKEFYFDIDYKDTFVRLGRQQIVWGKTDAFRLQDLVNPMDLSIHNIFSPLEERRIPVLALDLIQSFGNVGPLQDVSLELVWVWDKFTPVQVGQCGEPWAFTAACEARADAGGHGLLNVSFAAVDEREWKLSNTEPGFRLEFRIPEPSIAFSLSGFWGFQDAGVARFRNHYSTTNPNPAMMLFLQGLGVPPGVLPGFDPYDQGQIAVSSATALATWQFLFGPGSGSPCDTTVVASVGQPCVDFITASGLQPLGWVWSTSEAIVEYPRVFTLGGSLDYQLPGLDTVLRLELAYDFDRKITNTKLLDGVDESDVFLGAIGLDRSWFIPWLNRNRTAFLSFQTFVEHVMDHDGGPHDGMVVHQTNVISTFFMENYWRNDSIVLTNFFAYDWAAQAWATGPKLRYVFNDNVFVEIGANLLNGKSKKFNIRDICADSTLNCLGDPTTWQAGNWQLINENFRRTAEAPWWGLESFADTIMEDRDEFWVGVTYQF